MSKKRKSLQPADLKKVEPVYNGLDRLKEDIERQDKVFCVCAVARDYHVGAKDAEETFNRATGGVEERVAQLEARHYKICRDDTIYVPANPASWFVDVEGEASRAQAEVDRVYELLRAAHPSYQPGERLTAQGQEFRERFLTAFKQLQRARILPFTTGNSAFSHQGMLLLIEPCFSHADLLIEYLRKPEILVLDEDSYDDPVWDRMLFDTHQKRMVADALMGDSGFGLQLLTGLRRCERSTASELAAREGIEPSHFDRVASTLAKLASLAVVELEDSVFRITRSGKEVLTRIEHRSELNLN